MVIPNKRRRARQAGSREFLPRDPYCRHLKTLSESAKVNFHLFFGRGRRAADNQGKPQETQDRHRPSELTVRPICVLTLLQNETLTILVVLVVLVVVLVWPLGPK